MDDRSSNLLENSDPFASDALMSAGVSGESLFVINLCAANVPQAIDAGSVQHWGIAGLDRYKLYQVSRMEDGRRRYRVRLGFFTSEADAEAVLQSVRGKFASAFSSCLAEEDVKHASGYLKKPLHEVQEIQDMQRTGRYRIPKITPEDLARVEGKSADQKTSSQPQPIAKNPAPAAKVAANVAANVATIIRQTTAPAPKSTAAAIKAAQEANVVEFEWAPPQKAVASPQRDPATQRQAQVAKLKAALKASTTAKTQPAIAKATAADKPVSQQAKPAPGTGGQFHVAAGRNIPDFGLSLTSEKVSPPAAHVEERHSPSQSPSTAQNSADLPRPLVSAEALAKLRAAAQPRQQAAVIPTLDSTQTIRTLTKTEKEDESAPKWYVVQLAVSDQPANLDTMPHLDIFEAYRLYSVAAVDGAVIRHTLRLGFFSEQVSAEAVMGYLKTFFHEPRIERVSDAEQKRFANAPLAKKPVAEAVKTHSQVITLEEKRGAKALEATPAPAPAATPAAKSTPARTASKSAAPAIKRSPQSVNGRKGAANKSNKTPTTGKYAHLTQEERTAIREARMLGLSETAIRRVENNSLLARLVDKLTK